MAGSGRSDASVQQFFLPTPGTSPSKRTPVLPRPDAPIGDGFTAEEVQEALRPKAIEEWHPDHEYDDLSINALLPGPKAVTFMGRVANIFDVANSPRTPGSAKGCVKLCIKDSTGAITVRLWYAARFPPLRLGSLVSIWTNHISNGENGKLSSASAPLFASLFPERDRNCHIMVHENSDNGMFKTPLGFREGIPLNGLMTLQNFVGGGYDVSDAKILVVVKSIGARKKVTRKDESVTENVNLQLHDDTAEATLGLWGTLASSPFSTENSADKSSGDCAVARQGWRPGETVLLLQGPGWKLGRTTYLSFTSCTVVDVDPHLPDAEWLRRWSLRIKSREAINPPFPENVFDKNGPAVVKCLFTISQLDEFARAAEETYQGFLSLMIMEMKLLELHRRNMLLAGECCDIPIYANALVAFCKGCERKVHLRLNPRILGQSIDETGAIAGGKMLLCDEAWHDLLGRSPEALLNSPAEMKYLTERLLFSRITVMFGWTGDASKAGGRVCVLRVQA